MGRAWADGSAVPPDVRAPLPDLLVSLPMAEASEALAASWLAAEAPEALAVSRLAAAAPEALAVSRLAAAPEARAPKSDVRIESKTYPHRNSVSHNSRSNASSRLPQTKVLQNL